MTSIALCLNVCVVVTTNSVAGVVGMNCYYMMTETDDAFGVGIDVASGIETDYSICYAVLVSSSFLTVSEIGVDHVILNATLTDVWIVTLTVIYLVQ